MANPMKIKRSVRMGGDVYGPGQEDELNEVLTSKQVDDLKSRRFIEGDFKGKRKEGKELEKEKQAPPPARPQGAKRSYGEDTEDVETERGQVKTETDALPNGLPSRMQLIQAGFDTKSKLRKASDDELQEIEGIGEATVKKIREQLGESDEPEEDEEE